MKQRIETLLFTIAFIGAGISTSLAQQTVSLKPINFSDITIAGELSARTNRNLDRLQTDIYTPEKFDKPPYPDWPGDYQGRVMMGLILEAQVTGRNPKYLAEMLKQMPQKVNAAGYYGPLQGDTIAEQQLSGNSWLLRTLCEYYYWKKDPKVKEQIKKIVNNLVLPTKGYHKVYPIDPEERLRNAGGVVGSQLPTIGKWTVSSDIGTDFVFMDGVVQAYEVVPSAALKGLIEEMVARYLQMDIRGIRAQAHASLSGLRGVLRYYSITKDPALLNEIIKRYTLYRSTAMTANYENFNWFDRPEWTEPCAIVDSYLLAVQLWQYTGNAMYLEDAHHIYYNGLSNTQKANGGFSISSCVRPDHNLLDVHEEEAWWCCTMRGAEGLARAVQYNYFMGNKELIVPFFNSSEATVRFNNKSIELKQVSAYPFEGKVELECLSSAMLAPVIVKLAAPSWTRNHQLTVNGAAVPFKIENGMLIFTAKFSKGTKFQLLFDQVTGPSVMVNEAYSKPGFYMLNYGPLVLGYETNKQSEVSFTEMPELVRLAEREWQIKGKDIRLSPVYHLMDPKISKQSGYAKQVLFKIQK